jgi:prepilin-type processing-associated H-X9-DG protein
MVDCARDKALGFVRVTVFTCSVILLILPFETRTYGVQFPEENSPPGVVSGYVRIQGQWMNQSAQITFELRAPGTTMIVANPSNDEDPLLEGTQVTSGFIGQYTLSGVPAGTYDITAKGRKWLKQIGMALSLYANDGNGQFPPNKLGIAKGYLNEQPYFANALYPAYIDSKALFFCPGNVLWSPDNTWPDDPNVGWKGYMSNSYVYLANAKNPISGTWWLAPTGVPEDVRVEGIKSNPNYRVMMDQILIDGGTNLSNHRGGNNATGANTLFVDGHVEWWSRNKFTYTYSWAGQTYWY